MIKKLNLSTLKVNSFITTLDTQLAETAKGGGRSRLAGSCANNCDLLDCDRSRVGGSCGTSCGTNASQAQSGACCGGSGGVVSGGGTETGGVGIATNPNG